MPGWRETLFRPALLPCVWNPLKDVTRIIQITRFPKVNTLDTVLMHQWVCWSTYWAARRIQAAPNPSYAALNVPANDVEDDGYRMFLDIRDFEIQDLVAEPFPDTRTCRPCFTITFKNSLETAWQGLCQSETVGSALFDGAAHDLVRGGQPRLSRLHQRLLMAPLQFLSCP